MRISTGLMFALPFVIIEPLSAAGIDISRALICAPREYMTCAIGGECQMETAETANAPTFVKISVNDKAYSGTRVDGEVQSGTIDNIKKTDARLFLQGVEGPLGWSLSISMTTGQMTLTASGDQVGFVAFGSCTTI
jgi:hypothetical protein